MILTKSSSGKGSALCFLDKTPSLMLGTLGHMILVTLMTSGSLIDTQAMSCSIGMTTSKQLSKTCQVQLVSLSLYTVPSGTMAVKLLQYTMDGACRISEQQPT